MRVFGRFTTRFEGKKRIAPPPFVEDYRTERDKCAACGGQRWQARQREALMDHTAQAHAWHPDTIAWQEIAPDGTRYALLEGRRDVPRVAFTYAFFIPAGFWDPAHWHTADARVAVLRGTLFLGYSDVMERLHAHSYPAGSYVLVPAGARHFDGSDENTLIIGTAVGPWSTHYVDHAHQASAGTVQQPENDTR